ncbi:MAG: AraC family transcriptional regulator [Pseudomonadota bacterium]
MKATYVTQTFPRHFHDGFGFGVIEQGALEFQYRGEKLVASKGCINLVNPGEVHTGQAASDQGWTYRMFYVAADLLTGLASQMADKPQQIPFFRPGVIQDPCLAAELHHLHHDLEHGIYSGLETESRFLVLLSDFIHRHAEEAPRSHKPGNETGPLRRVLDFMEHHCGEEISISRLAKIAAMSEFHFIRVFRRALGVTPHACLMQIRTSKARDLIDRGVPLAMAALEAGFTDQSHLTRHFRRLMGFTPGLYSQASGPVSRP